MAGSNKKLRGVTEVVTQNHKRILNETEWSDLGSGNRPTNSTAQTFGLVDDAGFPILDSHFNQVTAAFGGLGGVESLPSQVTYIGAEGESGSVDPPTYNQLAVAGFAKPLGKYDNFIRKSAAKKASQINDQLDASEKVAARANADVLMKARVEEAEKIYNDLYKQYEAEKKAVDEYNKNVDNAYEKEKEKVRVHNEKIMMQHHKTISGVKWDPVRQMGVPDIDNVPAGSDLDIQNKLNAKYFKNGVMTITPEKWAKLHAEMGGKANEETRKRLEKKIKPDPERPPYKNYPPVPDYPDVYNDSIWKDGLNSSTNTVSINFENNPIIDEPPTPKKDSLLDIILSHVGKSTPPKALLNLLPSKLKEAIISKWDIIAASAKVFDLFLEGKTDLITNDIVGDLYMDQFIKEQKFEEIDFNGTVGTVVPDGIVGTAPLPTYKDGILTQTANFSFNNNWEEFVENVNKGVYKYKEKTTKQGILQLILNGGYAVLGELIPILDYAVDANIDPLPPVLAQLGGIFASWGIHDSKKDGGGKDIPINLTYSAEELYKNNDENFWVLVHYGVISKEDAAEIVHGKIQTKKNQKLKEGKTFKNFMSSINN